MFVPTSRGGNIEIKLKIGCGFDLKDARNRDGKTNKNYLKNGQWEMNR
jgi:hypothetical protein